MASITKKARKSYTVQQKLNIISKYKPNEFGFQKLSSEYGIPVTNLKRWYNQKEELTKLLRNTKISVKNVRRLEGGGRNEKFTELESLLFDWVAERNKNGLRVKDVYIQMKARDLCRNLYENNGNEDYSTFKASGGWLDNFKKRHNLVSRRQTTTRTLPDNATNIITNFQEQIFQIIEQKNIDPMNIINIDQVPRYFESQAKSSITQKGSRNILLRNASSSHKRCTVTFCITMAGKILQPHILFSNLKNKPLVSKGCLVDVNKTGMWNDQILDEYIKNIIIKRRETAFYKQPVLLLIDHYTPHVKLFNSKKWEKNNIFIILIPANLTGILQPLDVVQNRSFQEFYSTKYDEYISSAILDTELQTKSGNPKVPSYLTVSEWVLALMKTQTTESVKNAFLTCRIGPRECFNIDILHPPLKALLPPLTDINDWIEQYGTTLINTSYFEVDPSEWFFPSDEKTETSFFRCIMQLLKTNGTILDGIEFIDWIKIYCPIIVKIIKKNTIFDSLYGELDIATILKGECTTTRLELRAVSIYEKWEIKLIELNEEFAKIDEVIYKVEGSLKALLFVSSQEYLDTNYKNILF